MTHPCENKCTSFKDEPCAKCLIEQIESREFALGLAPESAYVKDGTSVGQAIDQVVNELFGEGESL